MYQRPSRLDDLHSLVYLMIYVINCGKIPELDKLSENQKCSDDRKLFKYFDAVLKLK